VPEAEPETHSFIIKLWLEEEADEGRRLWRGHITHVPDGNRRYLRRLKDILDFVSPYLETSSSASGRRAWPSRWVEWFRRRR
jgi:hypothetical protein